MHLHLAQHQSNWSSVILQVASLQVEVKHEAQPTGLQATPPSAAYLSHSVQALEGLVWRMRICQAALTGHEQLAETCGGPAKLSGSWPGHGVADSWTPLPPPAGH